MSGASAVTSRAPVGRSRSGLARASPARKQAVVDEDAGQPVADGALHQAAPPRNPLAGQAADAASPSSPPICFAHRGDERLAMLAAVQLQSRRSQEAGATSWPWGCAGPRGTVLDAGHLGVNSRRPRPAPEVEPRDNPSGATTASLWLIHTGCVSPKTAVRDAARAKQHGPNSRPAGVGDGAERPAPSPEAHADAEHGTPSSRMAGLSVAASSRTPTPARQKASAARFWPQTPRSERRGRSPPNRFAPRARAVR